MHLHNKRFKAVHTCGITGLYLLEFPHYDWPPIDIGHFISMAA
jgi:hypothetical protein